MKIIKTFVRDGKKYRAGDFLPPGLDSQTRAHYLRLGMIGDADPVPAEQPEAEEKPKKARKAAPAETKPAEPDEVA
jgi:hypothetical protein